MIKRMLGIKNTGSAFDTDAQAFIDATGITDETQQNAINTLVLAYKSAGIWTKRYAIYPYVGGTADTHKYNLKDPQDTDGAYRITWTNCSHDANGVSFTAGVDHGDTHLNCSTVMSINNNSYGSYTRTNATSTGWACGAGVDPTSYVAMQTRYTDGKVYAYISGIGSGVSTSDSLGLTTVSRQAAGNYQIYRDGSSISSQAVSSTGLPNLNYYVLGMNYGSALQTQHSSSFDFIGQGVDATEALAEYNAIQTFQTTLGRQV